MRFNKPIIIQKLNEDLEVWQDFGTKKYAEINQASGNEYLNAGTNISSKTLKFKIRFSKEIDDLQFNTELYRIIYKNKCFDIKNVDNFKQENNEVTIFAEYNGQSYFQTNNNLYKKAIPGISGTDVWITLFAKDFRFGETYTFDAGKYVWANYHIYNNGTLIKRGVASEFTTKQVFTIENDFTTIQFNFYSGVKKPNIADIDFSQVSIYKGKEY